MCEICNQALSAKASHKWKDGETTLHVACMEGDVKMLTALIVAKADPNASDKNGKTPLYIAAERGNEEVVIRLLQAKATVDHSGVTALSIASSSGKATVVGLLLAVQVIQGRVDRAARDRAVESQKQNVVNAFGWPLDELKIVNP